MGVLTIAGLLMQCLPTGLILRRPAILTDQVCRNGWRISPVEGDR